MNKIGLALERERAVLRRLERIRDAALKEGALGTPHLDRNISESRAEIERLETEHSGSASLLVPRTEAA